MIRVKVKRDSHDNPVLVEIRGHALFAPQGADIVCAGVSVLAQTVVYAMEELLGLSPPVKLKKGYLSLCRPAQLDVDKKEHFNLLFETMLLGIREVARSYPKYISVEQAEKVWEEEKND